MVILFSLLIINVSFASDEASLTENDEINENLEVYESYKESNEKLITKDNDNTKSSASDVASDYSQLKSKLNNKTTTTVDLMNKEYIVDEPVTYYWKQNITINGNGATLNGKNTNGFFNFGGDNLIINNVTFKNFQATSNGLLAGFKNSKLTLNDCKFINNTGQKNGACITNRGSLNVNNCLFENNKAERGSCIVSVENYMTSKVENSIFKNNPVVTERNTVLDITGTQNFTIDNCTFENNTGRSVHCYLNVNMKIKNSKFINMNNKYTVNPQGPVVDNYEADMSITNSTFDNISITGPRVAGGLIYHEIGNFLLENNTFSRIKITVPDKTSRIAGGVIWTRNATTNIRHNKFDMDLTTDNILGGVVYNNIGTVYVTNNTFKANLRAYNELCGGAMYNDYDANEVRKSRMYYGDNSFDGLNVVTAGKVLNKTIRNKGAASDLILIGAENKAPIKEAVLTVTAPKQIDTGMNATFTVNVIDKDSKQGLNGTIIFKINGLTLKDSKSNTFIIKTVNGKGSLSYSLKALSAKVHTVTAVFSKSGYDRTENSTKMTVNKVDYVMDPVTFTACSEKVITINQTVKDKNGNLVSGNNKVAIKINGKTILSTTITDGVLYAKVKLPYLPSGKLNLTVYLGNNFRYNTKHVSSTITIYKQNVSVSIDKITQKAGNKITIKAKLLNSETKTNVISGKYAFKIDSKTIPLVENNKEVFTTKSISNGVASWDYVLPANMNAGLHSITLVYNGNKQSNPIRVTEKVLTVTK